MFPLIDAVSKVVTAARRRERPTKYRLTNQHQDHTLKARTLRILIDILQTYQARAKTHT